MDPYDDAQHREDHPSHSIPNAAYPDSAYRPGEGHQTGASATASSSSHGLSNSGSFLPASQSSHSFYVSPQAPQQQSGPWVDGAAKPSNLSIPNGPPPPYDPSRTPSSYSPLAGASSSHQEPTHHNDIPLQDISPQDRTPVSAASGSSPHHYQQQAPQPGFQYQLPQPQPQPGYQPQQQHNVGFQHQNPQQQPANQLQVPPSPNPNGSGASTVSSKIGPLAAARLRKKRRMKICIVVAGAVVIFITALMIGIGLGVIKGALHDDNDDKPGHGPDHDD